MSNRLGKLQFRKAKQTAALYHSRSLDSTALSFALGRSVCLHPLECPSRRRGKARRLERRVVAAAGEMAMESSWCRFVLLCAFAGGLLPV